MSGDRDREYEFELTAGRAEAAAVLSDVVDGLHAGGLQVSDGSGSVTVDVPEELDLEVELELEDDEVSLELELTWPAGEEGTAVRHGAAPDGERAGGSVSPAGETDSEAPAEDADEDAATAASLARFELFRDRGDEWRWRLRHRNGNVIATSGEGYTRKHNAVKGLRSVMRNAPNAEVSEESSD